MQETLTANFEGTRSVLELAAAAGHLKALVHVSSAFVNINQPRSSIVDEQVYPLKFGHQVVDVEQLNQVGAVVLPRPWQGVCNQQVETCHILYMQSIAIQAAQLDS